MKYKFTRNLGLKVISILSACLIWLVVMDNNDPERTQAYKNVPVVIKNEDTITDANKTFTVVDNTDKVNVYVTARRSVRSRLNTSSFIVRADLENYNEAIGSVPLEYACTDPAVLPEHIRIVPASLKIKMEDKVEQSFAMVATVQGKAQKGYELGKATILTGDTIKIAGPESLINIIGKVSVVIDDISSLTEDKLGEYPVKIEDKNGATFNESQMGMLELKGANGVLLKNNMVEVGIRIWKIYENIPVEVPMNGTPTEGYRVTNVALTPATVNLVGSEEAMKNLGGKLVLNNTVNLDNVFDNREFTFDINDTLAAYKEIRLQADTPSVLTMNLRVEADGSRTIDFPVANIRLAHAPEKKKLIFSPADKLQINIQSTEENLENLKAEAVKVSVDLSECTENGSYTVPVEVELPESYELGAEVSIVVNVGDMENETEREAEVVMEE